MISHVSKILGNILKLIYEPVRKGSDSLEIPVVSLSDIKVL